MLVVTLRPQERVFVNGEEIIITYVKQNGKQIRLGIECDKEKFKILREKNYEQVKKEIKE